MKETDMRIWQTIAVAFILVQLFGIVLFARYNRYEVLSGTGYYDRYKHEVFYSISRYDREGLFLLHEIDLDDKKWNNIHEFEDSIMESNN